MGCSTSTEVKRIPNNPQTNGNVLIRDGHKIALNEQNKENRADNNRTPSEDNSEKEEEAATKIQAQFRGYKARKDFELKKSMKEDESPVDDNDVHKAATTIQAGFKGYKVRKEYKKQKSGSSSIEGSPKKDATKGSVSDEIADIDLNDPEVEKAATKIQATFRGYKTRKEPNSK